MSARRIPQFHLYGEEAAEDLFDYVHIEPLTNRSPRHGWIIGPHAHRNLHQLTIVFDRGGEVVHDGDGVPFRGPAVVVSPAGVVHGFRFEPDTDGRVVNFTDDVLDGFRDAAGSVDERLAALAENPVLALSPSSDVERLRSLADGLAEEEALARDGHRIALRATLALLVIEIVRAKASEVRYAEVTLRRRDATVERLRALIDARFREARRPADYAAMLGMTTDRLNDHCRRATGVTVAHLLRQRLLTEAKRQLLFTDLSISEIAYDLKFADPTHFSRFVRRSIGRTPQAFRAGERRALGDAGSDEGGDPAGTD